MSKKIAIQLFGHLRSFRVTYRSLIKNIVETNKIHGYDVDLFIHTWKETDHSTVSWHNQNGQKRGRIVTEDTINEIHDYYSPKMILVEDQIDTIDYVFPEKIAGVPRAYKGVVNVTYTVCRSSELRREYAKKNDIQYDYIIVTRPDVMFHEQFSIDDILASYNKYSLDIPVNGLFFAYNLFGNTNAEDKRLIAGSDILYFGTEYAIDRATSLYNVFKQEDFNVAEFTKNFMRFEVLWYNYWIEQGLDPIRIKYYQFGTNNKLSFSIIRNVEEYEGYRKKNILLKLFRITKKVIKNALPYGILRLVYPNSVGRD